MMLPLKVSMLSEKIATVYLEVSNKYIMPAQRCVPASPNSNGKTNVDRIFRSVGGMMEFSDDTSEAGRAALKGMLLL